jgi:hypothetical protein
VKLVTRSAGPRSAYDWEYSTDGAKTWTQLPSTVQAKTTMGALPVGTAVQFRFRSVTKGGESDWSLPVTLIVK